MKYITVDHNDCVELKRTQFEYQMAKDNLCSLLSMNQNSEDFLDSPIYKRYSQNEQDKYNAYMDEKAKFTEKYINPLNENGNSINWTLWFSNDVVAYEEG